METYCHCFMNFNQPGIIITGLVFCLSTHQLFRLSTYSLELIYQPQGHFSTKLLVAPRTKLLPESVKSKSLILFKVLVKLIKIPGNICFVILTGILTSVSPNPAAIMWHISKSIVPYWGVEMSLF